MFVYFNLIFFQLSSKKKEKQIKEKAIWADI